MTELRRLLWANLVLGIWLMLSPFVLQLLYQGVFKTTWEDFILGFAIALISFGRLFSHTTEEILVTDWIVTVAAIHHVHPLLYNYYGIRLATMNNLVIGAGFPLCDLCRLERFTQDRANECSLSLLRGAPGEHDLGNQPEPDVYVRLRR